MKTATAKANGFTLLEALIATVVAVIILGAAIAVFKSTSDVNRIGQLRADMQQDARGALNIINRDLSQAATGMPPAGIPVPKKAVFACGPTQCYLGGIGYPNNILSSVVPDGAIGANGTDAITIAYVDATWPVNAKDLVAIAPNGGAITVNQGSFDPNGNPAAPPAGRDYRDPVVGTQVGDVLLLQNNNGPAVVTVTGVAGGGVLTLAPADPLLLNTPGAAALANKDKSFPAKTGALRINIVTYFVSIFPPPPAVGGVPVLMRQVSAHTAVPVAENAQTLQFRYDIFDPTVGPNGTYTSALPANAVNDSSQIRKVSMSLTLRSAYPDPQGVYRTLTVNSAVAPRDLSFSDRYQ